MTEQEMRVREMNIREAENKMTEWGKGFADYLFEFDCALSKCQKEIQAILKEFKTKEYTITPTLTIKEYSLLSWLNCYNSVPASVTRTKTDGLLTLNHGAQIPISADLFKWFELEKEYYVCELLKMAVEVKE
jgi:hypothetical protein